jgi:hypothetical protein
METVLRKFMALATAGSFVFAVVLAWAQKPMKTRQPFLVRSSTQTPQGPIPFTVSNSSVTPASVTFTSSNPDGSVNGSATTTVQFRTTNSPAHFTVYAQASAASFSGCNNPPAGSIAAACSAPTGVTCAAAGALTNSGNGTVVATGNGNHNPARFNVTYTFTDGWNFQVGASCSLTVQYVYTEP